MTQTTALLARLVGSAAEDTWLQAMARTAQIMAEASDPDNALQAVAAVAGRALDATVTCDLREPEGPHANTPASVSDCDVADEVPGEPPEATHCLALPLVVEGRHRGGIQLVRRRRQSCFTAGEAAFAQALGTQVSAGLSRLEQLRHISDLAFTDALTGLSNRRAMDHALQNAVQRNKHEGIGVAVIFCDLNGLKHVNDIEGHQAGDRLLKEFAAELARCARALTGCCTARLGGDEFCLIACGHRREEVMHVAARICRATRRLGQGDGLSCGVAFLDRTSQPTTPGALLQQADAAQYRAKQHKAYYPVVAGPDEASTVAAHPDTRQQRRRFRGMERQSTTETAC
ncbi:sensor domain-containing diguanylate cyclase [Streptomyces sp. NBC_01619]|uniref:GGDEF domain-containing protein n=1 Tax=Streptomyces sp. NBC_01619 TaxID=2975901 RepID=UPI00225C42FA|nr:sensor domain-containing diguanylate cyclase [Streptomyces sp. NBC_01619]MCX4515882.1 sensor domain-containing diguanylate cyclase [Streptomyces sp. NBC_01619]